MFVYIMYAYNVHACPLFKDYIEEINAYMHVCACVCALSHSKKAQTPSWNTMKHHTIQNYLSPLF